MTETKRTPSFPRRQVLKAISLAGVSSALFGRALVAMAEDAAGAAPVPSVTREMIERAEWVSGVKLTDEKRDLLLKGLAGSAADFEKLRAVPLDNSVQPAFHVDASFAFGAASEMPGNAAHAGSGASPHSNRTAKWIPPAGDPKKPQSEEDLAYASIPTLAALLRARKVSSSELARVYFDRLERADPVLKCVINLTRPLAKEQSSKADDELMKGLARGPLHGIPYGAKDLLAVPGYPTTWGATPYKDQVRPEKATVIARLENERAVLLAKTAVGELAWGDVWYGGTTKNPWNTAQGSSGSFSARRTVKICGMFPTT